MTCSRAITVHSDIPCLQALRDKKRNRAPNNPSKLEATHCAKSLRIRLRVSVRAESRCRKMCDQWICALQANKPFLSSFTPTALGDLTSCFCVPLHLRSSKHGGNHDRGATRLDLCNLFSQFETLTLSKHTTQCFRNCLSSSFSRPWPPPSSSASKKPFCWNVTPTTKLH